MVPLIATCIVALRNVAACLVSLVRLLFISQQLELLLCISQTPVRGMVGRNTPSSLLYFG